MMGGRKEYLHLVFTMNNKGVCPFQLFSGHDFNALVEIIDLVASNVFEPLMVVFASFCCATLIHFHWLAVIRLSYLTCCQSKFS